MKKIIAAVMTGLVVGACSVADNVANRANRGSQSPADTPTETPSTADDPAFTVNSIQPARGEQSGGTQVDVIGLGFTPTMRVYFGDVMADPALTQVRGEYLIETIAPPQTHAGFVTVRVVDEADAAMLESGYEYYERVTLSGIDPGIGPSTGGTALTLYGTGFIAGSRVKIGGVAVSDVTLVDNTTLRVAVPPLPAGQHTVTLTNMNGTASLSLAYKTFAPVTLAGVTPNAGNTLGGSLISIHGTGLGAGTWVKLGQEQMPSSSNSDETELQVNVPILDQPRPEGPVDISVGNDNGTALISNAFVFVDSTNTTPRLIAVTPQVSLVEGGTRAAIISAGLQGTPVQVLFGGIPATHCETTATTGLSCDAPAHAAGSVDVTVRTDRDETVTLARAFKYVDLRIESIGPDRGSIAGGTFVYVYGSGFGSDSRVYFDGIEARDIGATDSEKLTLRTPPHGLGSVDVQIATQGLRVTLPAAFNYFDPADTALWTSGGPIDGEINVTVINSSNQVLPTAYVMVGDTVDDAAPYLSGFTNAQGQVTLSGPNLHGPLSIHAIKPGHGAFSWIDIDATNLVMMLEPFAPPPPDPLPDCPSGASAGLPRVRGKVSRIKDEYNTGDDVVLVTTTYVNFSSPLPNPGPGGQLTSQGDFEINTRTGDMVVVAMAGYISDQGTLDVHALGFKPFIFTEASTGTLCVQQSDCPADEQCLSVGSFNNQCTRVYEDVNIVIDTPLNQPMRIDFDNAPLRRNNESFFVSAPDTSNVLVWYDFGYMGLHPIVSVNAPGAPSTLVNMPKHLPSALQNATFDIRGGVSTAAGFPLSEVWLRGLHDTRQSVLLTPLLKTHADASHSRDADGSELFSFNLRPSDAPNPDPTTTFHALYQFESVQLCKQAPPISRPVVYWYIFSPGESEVFDLPDFPARAGNVQLAPGTYYWQLASYYTPGVSIQNSDLNGLFDWLSNSLDVTAVGIGP